MTDWLQQAYSGDILIPKKAPLREKGHYIKDFFLLRDVAGDQKNIVSISQFAKMFGLAVCTDHLVSRRKIERRQFPADVT